jgi:hypothetical protein
MAAGRPLKFSSPEELKQKAEGFFERCIAEDRPITITGLALALDTTRETLCDYQKKDEFSDTVTKIKLRVEQYAEEQLYVGKAATGPIFALKNYGWRDSQDVNLGGQGGENPVRSLVEISFVDPVDETEE